MCFDKKIGFDLSEVALEIQRALGSQLIVEAIASSIKAVKAVPSRRIANVDF